jgi:hypothetical protein
MISKMRVFTSCNLAYLPQAMVLLESLRKYHDDCLVTLVLVEEKRRFPTPIEMALRKFDQVMFPEDIWGSERFKNLFPYTVVEACTAIKGPALAMLLEQDLPVVYLDPDVVVFNRLDPILHYLDSASILLTPHQLDPINPEGWGELHDERVSLLTGVFNFGFIAVAPTDEGKSFAKWWKYRTTQHSFENPDFGLFTDQKWGNLVPVLFSETHILRHRGMNVASWNLHERNLCISNHGNYLVDADPLLFFHFTKGHRGVQPVIQKAVHNCYVASIWRWYLEKLDEERAKFSFTEWSYARYRDGQKQMIEQHSRRKFRNVGERTYSSKNPFYQE